MNTGRVRGRQGAIDDEAILAVFGVDEILAVVLDSRGARTILADLVVLTVIRSGTNATSNSVTWLPVDREVVASAVVDTSGLLGVLGKARLFIDTNGVALGAIVLLLGEVVGISRAPDTRNELASKD